MPELIDELNAMKKQLTLLDADLRALKEASTKAGEGSGQLSGKIAELEKHRDELRTEIAELRAARTVTGGTPAPKPPKSKEEGEEHDDGIETGFW